MWRRDQVLSWGLITLQFNAGLTAIIYTFICLIFLGLKEVAVAMNDPFGDDDVDFEVEKMLQGAYKNAVAVLSDCRQPLGTTAGGVGNPLKENLQFLGVTAAGIEPRRNR